MDSKNKKQFEGGLSQEEKEKNKIISMLKYKLEELEESPAKEVEEKVDSLLLSLLKEGKSFETNCQEESIDRLKNYIDDFDSSYMEETRSLYDISHELTESENNSGSWLYNSQKAKLELFRFELESSDFFLDVKSDLESSGFNLSEQGENTHLLLMLNGVEKTLLDKANELGMDTDEIKIEDLKEMVNELSGEKEYNLEKDLEPWRQEALATLREEGEVSYKLEHGTDKTLPKEKESKIPKKEKKSEGNER